MNNSRENILKTIRQNKPIGNFQHPEIPSFKKNTLSLSEEFKTNLVIGGGTWVEIKEVKEIEAFISKIHPDAKVICSATPEVKGNKNISSIKNPHELNDVDVGVIRAEFGVSENGMVWITEKDLQVNALGFLSQHLVILLDPDKLAKDMYEAYKKVELDKNNYGCFMLGPSATADIGAVMVHGAQGARTLTVCFCPNKV